MSSAVALFSLIYSQGIPKYLYLVFTMRQNVTKLHMLYSKVAVTYTLLYNFVHDCTWRKMQDSAMQDSTMQDSAMHFWMFGDFVLINFV